MDGDQRWPVAVPVAMIPPADVDEFDLDLRIGELGRGVPASWLGIPLAAQTDPQCELPTGGRGAGTTCNTNDNTCPATCAGLNTCPHTQCGNTCAATCANTCDTCATCDTCPRTDCDCFTDNVHVNTCRNPCQPR